MPLTTRVYVKVSFVYLGLGAVLGALLLSNHWTSWWPALYALKSSHVAFLVVGWLTQLILGVAWWLLPPLEIGLHSDDPNWERHGQTQRGSERLFWITFACLNAGIVLEAVTRPLYLWTGSGLFDILACGSALLLLAAAVTFVLNMWARVRQLGAAR